LPSLISTSDGSYFEAFSHTFFSAKKYQNKGTAFAKQNVSLEKALATASSPTDSQRRANKPLKTENSLRSDSSVFLTRFICSSLALQVLRSWLTC